MNYSLIKVNISYIPIILYQRRELDEKLKNIKAKHDEAILKTKESLEKQRVEEIKKLQATMQAKLMTELEAVEKDLENKFEQEKQDILLNHKKVKKYELFQAACS